MRRDVHLMSHERQISCPLKTSNVHFHSIARNSELPKPAAADQPTLVTSGRRDLWASQTIRSDNNGADASNTRHLVDICPRNTLVKAHIANFKTYANIGSEIRKKTIFTNKSQKLSIWPIITGSNIGIGLKNIPPIASTRRD